MNKVLLAQKGEPLGGWLEGLGYLGKVAERGIIVLSPERAIENATELFNTVISNIIGVMTVVAGLWFIFQFIISAFQYLTSGGDKAKTQEAQQKITMALIGLVVVIAAIFIIDLVGALLGLDILRPGQFILDMWS